MSDEEIIHIPDLVDEPVHFLVWQFDEIATVAIGLVVGIVINSPALGIIFGLGIKRFYIRMRDGKPKGYFIHRLRETGLAFDKCKAESAMQPPLVDKYYL